MPFQRLLSESMQISRAAALVPAAAVRPRVKFAWLRSAMLLALVAFGIAAAFGSEEEVVLPFDGDSVSMLIDLETWQPSSAESDHGLSMIEWVLAGESPDEWSQMFTAMRIDRRALPSADARRFSKNLVENLGHRCENDAAISHSFIKESPVDTLLVWTLGNCQSELPYSFDQQEYRRTLVGKRFLFSISFTQNQGGQTQLAPEQISRFRQQSLDALNSARIVEMHVDPELMGFDEQLMQLAIYRTYSKFASPDEPGDFWLEEINREGTGKSASVTYVLKSDGLPPDHWYAVWLIKSPEGWSMPLMYGLKVNEEGELACPESMDHMPPVTPVVDLMGKEFTESGVAKSVLCKDTPGKALRDFWSANMSDFQMGLAFGYGVQTHDGSHRYLARATPRPLEASDEGCTIELELASDDGRAYILRGDGFLAAERLKLYWNYAKGNEEFALTTQSDGSFEISLFHERKARGRKKWKAEIRAIGGRCEPKLNYSWGKEGMRK